MCTSLKSISQTLKGSGHPEQSAKDGNVGFGQMPSKMIIMEQSNLSQQNSHKDIQIK